MDHDLLLTSKDGSVRCFRLYDRTIPKEGDVITLPIDGRVIKVSVKGPQQGLQPVLLADVEAVEI
jgi:hypothetical protein